VGDRGGDFGDRRRGEGTEREPGDGGRRFVASEPVEKNGEEGLRHRPLDRFCGEFAVRRRRERNGYCGGAVPVWRLVGANRPSGR
jgi:hypothetical protein